MFGKKYKIEIARLEELVKSQERDLMSCEDLIMTLRAEIAQLKAKKTTTTRRTSAKKGA